MRVFSFPELPLYLQVTTSTGALKIRMNLIIREQNECIAVWRNKVIEGWKSFNNTPYLLILSQFDIQSPCNKVVSWETASVFRIKACMEGLTGLIALRKLIERNTFCVCVCQKQRSTKGIGKGLPDSCAKYWKFAFTRTRKHRNTPGTNRQKTWQLVRVTDVILACEQALYLGIS